MSEKITAGRMAYFLSVIICTYNNVELLKRSLSAILNQSLENNKFEILVIDNNSDDGTEEYIKEIISLHENLRYIKEPNQGLSYARNRAVKESRGEIITYIDDDAIAEKDFLKVVIEKFKTYPSILCLGGKVIPQIDFYVPIWFIKKYRNFLVLSYDAGDRDVYLDKMHGPVGANISFKRSVFEKFGLFDVNLGRNKDKYLANEEELFIRRIKCIVHSCLYSPDAIVRHVAKPTRVGRRFLLHRAFYKGISDARSGYKKSEIIHGLGKPFLHKLKDALQTSINRIVPTLVFIFPSLLIIKSINPALSKKDKKRYISITSKYGIYGAREIKNETVLNKCSIVIKEKFTNLRESIFYLLFMVFVYNLGFYSENYKLYLFKPQKSVEHFHD